MVMKPKYRQHLFVSLFFHVVVLSILVFSFEFSSRNFVLENSNKDDIVNAVIIDRPSKVQMAHSAPKVLEAKKILPKPVPPPKPKPVVQKNIEVKKQLEPVKQQAIAIPDKQKKQQKDLIEKQLLADLKKQTEKQKEKQKKLKQKSIEEALESDIKEQAAKALEQQLKEEKNRMASISAEKLKGIVDKYKALITQAIAQHWLVPSGVNKKLSSELLIRIAPGGTVLDVQIVKSSGDEALDLSARTAVFKASPLPVPSKSDEFEPFRQFILKVKPENVVTRELGLN